MNIFKLRSEIDKVQGQAYKTYYLVGKTIHMK
jgi:hypothetical protein